MHMPPMTSEDHRSQLLTLGKNGLALLTVAHRPLKNVHDTHLLFATLATSADTYRMRHTTWTWTWTGSSSQTLSDDLRSRRRSGLLTTK